MMVQMRTTAALCLLLAAVAFGQDRAPKPFSVEIPTRDGEKLAADVFLPSRWGRFPTIFIFTPYDRKILAAAVPAAELKNDLLEKHAASPYARKVRPDTRAPARKETEK